MASAKKLIEHLMAWGEITRFELSGFAGDQDWIPVFESADVLHTKATDTWCLSSEFWSLLREESEKAVRIVLFQVLEYRDYLISILAEGVASAANQGLYDELEKWSGSELLPFLSSINRILDKIEVNGYRLVDGTSAEISQNFDQYRKRKISNVSLLTSNSLSDWSQLLLGRTARLQNLFDFVLKRFVAYALPEPCKAHCRTPALLPILPWWMLTAMHSF